MPVVAASTPVVRPAPAPVIEPTAAEPTEAAIYVGADLTMLRAIVQQDQALLIGHTYEVPCVEWARGVYVPVHLPIHSDPDLGTPQPHVHLDLRFLSIPDLARAMSDPFLAFLASFVGPRREAVLLGRLFFQVISAEPQDIVMRSMVCQRQMPAYPRHLAGWLQEGSPFLLPYRDLCPSSNRCPHKGLPLFTGADGRRQCPGHGLCFDAPETKPASAKQKGVP